jgi:nucleoside-diphosphate-sugar epimerase
MYEATKGAGSLLTLASKLPAVIARPFSVFGRNEPQRRFIPIIYNSYKTGKPLSVGPGVHDFIYIDDFVDGLEMCANGLLSGSIEKDIVNFGTGIQYTNEEVAMAFEDVVGSKLNWVRSETKKPYDSMSWVCDTTYAREKYGYKPKVDLRTGLERYIRYREETDEEDS